MIKVTINGRTVEVEKGSTLLEASRIAGVHIPTLCYYPRLPSHAVCRLSFYTNKIERLFTLLRNYQITLKNYYNQYKSVNVRL